MDRAPETEKFLLGKKWDRKTGEEALQVLKKEASEFTIRTRGSYDYKVTLCLSLFWKFFLKVLAEVDPSSVTPEEKSAFNSDDIHHTHHVGSQTYDEEYVTLDCY